MEHCELKCLRCKENIFTSIEDDKRFSIFCIANEYCVEREDRVLEEKNCFSLTKWQFEIITKAIGLKLAISIEQL